MTNYSKLQTAVTLPNGACLNTPIVMSPMVINASTDEGIVTQLDLNYIETRAAAASLIITGATSISQQGRLHKHQLAMYDKRHLEGLSKLREAGQKEGNKIVVQIQHAGREAEWSQEAFGRTVAPSAINFSFLDYMPDELTNEEILQAISEFGKGTKLAIEAGFDGVEIHGANHYLLQQFFSTISNKRTDQWGGSLTNRMRFPLAVIAEVKRVAARFGKSDFIIGYRMSPEEIHGTEIGYDIDDSLALVREIAETNIDYLHLSLFNRYDVGPKNATRSYGQLVKKALAGKMPLIIVFGVFSPDEALTALEHGDLVAIAREALIEPEFAKKILENRFDEIKHEVRDNIDELALPDGAISAFLKKETGIPPLPGIESLDVAHIDPDLYW